MKFVLVIDVADDVAESYEDFTVDYDFRGTPKEDRTVNESIKYIEDAEPIPLPNRWIPQVNGLSTEQQIRNIDFASGWNACLKKITGETE